MQQRSWAQVAGFQQLCTRQHLERWPVCDQIALLQKQNALCKAQSKIKIMGDEEQRIQIGQTAQIFHEGNVRTVILSCSWLIEQQDFALHCQHRSNRYPFLLPEAKRERRAI